MNHIYVCNMFTKQCPAFFATPWSVSCRSLLSIGFLRQEYWNGLPFPSQGELPNPGIKPRSPESQADLKPYIYLKALIFLCGEECPATKSPQFSFVLLSIKINRVWYIVTLHLNFIIYCTNFILYNFTNRCVTSITAF